MTVQTRGRADGGQRLAAVVVVLFALAAVGLLLWLRPFAGPDHVVIQDKVKTLVADACHVDRDTVTVEQTSVNGLDDHVFSWAAAYPDPDGGTSVAWAHSVHDPQDPWGEQPVLDDCAAVRY